MSGFARIVTIAFFALCSARLGGAQTWTALAPIPDGHGFASPYAGVIGNTLVVAGGANFPDKKPWEGGKKVWHDRVYALDKPNGHWKLVGRLPRPLGYGVSDGYRETLVCAGGSDSDRHYADCFKIRLEAGKLEIVTLPSLPEPTANCAGCIVGDDLLVIGGQSAPTSDSALARVWRLDLSDSQAKWETLPDLPGKGRILPVVASAGGRFYVIGGAALSHGKDGKIDRTYLSDAYAFDFANGWKRLQDCPSSIVAAPSPAPLVEGTIVVLGGDDGTQVGVPPQEHHGFSRRSYRYNIAANEWSIRGDVEQPRVTAPCIRWGNTIVIPSGEMRPGIRSNSVWSIDLDNLEDR